MFLLKVDNVEMSVKKLLQFVQVTHQEDQVIIQILQEQGVIVLQELEAIPHPEVPQLEVVVIPEEAVRLELEVHLIEVLQKEEDKI